MNNYKRYSLILIVTFIIYNILVWVIPYPKQDITTFIISYIASIVAFLAQPIIHYTIICRNDSAKSKLYGVPVIKIGYLYLIIQLVLTLLFYILGAFLDIPWWISLVLCTLILSLALIGSLITESYREEVEKIENEVAVSTRFILDLRIDSAAFARKITNEKIHDELVNFAELVKYSDPVSSDELIDIEDEIGKKFILVKELVVNYRFLEAKDELRELYSLMEERNERCKLLKK